MTGSRADAAAAGDGGPDGGAGPEGSPRGQRAIRRRLVAVAGDLFIQQGYRATTTRQICERARTTERTLFRHFASKAGLFEATVVDPFAEFVDQWLASFGQFPPDTALDEQNHTFVRALVGFLHDNRELLRLLMAAEFEHDETLLRWPTGSARSSRPGCARWPTRPGTT